ncbi:hypothetical protein NP493_745g01034 [Ridgeia piscesae]|uniref:RWD domain-containing protein 3 n=1 Tax=Ridgeia piscesae TaxID=27915 RepID=A0AAD9NQ07_RIDPI|nr:hypothetical protein NP493_745g01034 [Ridgeia piscesae]
MFLIHVPGDGCTTATILTVKLRSDEPHSHTVDITFTLKNDYPLCVPDISLSCPSLSRTDSGLLKADVERYADTLIGQPMLLMLTLYVKERLENFKVDSTEAQVKDHDRCRRRIVLLHLDHMRAKVRYIKTIGQWAEELALTGRLICHERLILILLEGTEDDLKEYLVRHRTVSIDVDSKGRDCKERMMSVLMDEIVDTTAQRFTYFEVAQLLKATEVEEVFVKSGLKSEYETYVVPLMKRQ